MGVTSHSNRLLQGFTQYGKKMLELGSQNTYFDGQRMGVAKNYYAQQGFEHVSVDLNGDYGSLTLDLSQPQKIGQFDMVTDFGTSEHVPDFYNCWLNKHDNCRIGGVIISENPKVGNWPDHGYHYVTMEFYQKLAYACGYKVLALGEHPAMGNDKDGWNVYCVLEKTKEAFIDREQFHKLPYESSNYVKAEPTNVIEAAEGYEQGKLTPQEQPAEQPAPKKRGRKPKQ